MAHATVALLRQRKFDAVKGDASVADASVAEAAQRNAFQIVRHQRVWLALLASGDALTVGRAVPDVPDPSSRAAPQGPL
jgi:hypothetical protein